MKLRKILLAVVFELHVSDESKVDYVAQPTRAPRVHKMSSIVDNQQLNSSRWYSFESWQISVFVITISSSIEAIRTLKKLRLEHQENFPTQTQLFSLYLSSNNFSFYLDSSPLVFNGFNLSAQHVQRVKMWNLKVSSCCRAGTDAFNNVQHQYYTYQLSLFSEFHLYLMSFDTSEKNERVVAASQKLFRLFRLSLFFYDFTSLLYTFWIRDYKGKLICPGCQQSLNVAFILHFTISVLVRCRRFSCERRINDKVSELCIFQLSWVLIPKPNHLRNDVEMWSLSIRPHCIYLWLSSISPPSKHSISRASAHNTVDHCSSGNANI